MTFSPPLTKSGGGTGPSEVTGRLSHCSASTSAVSVTGGTVTGSFTESPINCGTPSTPAGLATLDVSWKGQVNGAVGATTYAGPATFTTSTVTGEAVGVYGYSQPGTHPASNVTGSFSGYATASALTPTSFHQLLRLCSRKLKTMALSGTINVGTTKVVVAPPDLVTGSPLPGQFVVINQSGDQGGVGIVYGPATPPLGQGSLQLNVTGTNDHWSVYNYDHIGTKLSDISALGYSTYTDNGTTDPVLQMEINPGNSSGTDAGVTYSTLNFEPYLQSAGVTPNTWQTWDVLSGNVWGTNLTGAPDGYPLSWSDFLATYPNATIIGGFGIDVGSGWSAMTGEANALTIGTAATFSYDFEPVAPPTPPGIQITTTSLPSGVLGTRYSTTLAASGGNLPYRWSVSVLPHGLHLNKHTGVISGTPPMNVIGDIGMFTFNVTVVDKKIHHMHHSATAELSITIS